MNGETGTLKGSGGEELCEKLHINHRSAFAERFACLGTGVSAGIGVMVGLWG